VKLKGILKWRFGFYPNRFFILKGAIPMSENVLKLVKNDPNELYMREYLLYLKGDRGARPKTMMAYASDLREFLTAFQTHDVLELRQAQIRDYKFELVNRGLAPRTVNRKLTVLRSFYTYFVENDEYDIVKNPVKNIKNMPVPKTIPVTLGESQAKTLLDGIILTGRYALRDYALFSTFLFTGLRVSEICKLQTHDIDFEENLVIVRDGKGGKDRLVPMIGQLASTLQMYLRNGTVQMDEQVRKKKGKRSKIDRAWCGRSYFANEKSGTTLFLTKYGGEFTREGIDFLFKEYTKKLGLYKPGLSLHAMRRSCLTYLYRQGVDLYTLQQISGHSSMDTLRHYLAVDDKQLHESMKKHPLSQRSIDFDLVSMVRNK
jgi:site-specific recombinase XerD